MRNPRILLLDEATSALDSASEASVQTALERAKEGRTTIIVAHRSPSLSLSLSLPSSSRLSTVRNSDKIVAIRGGCVEEEGTHEQLMARRSLYHSLVTAQLNRWQPRA